MKVLIYSDIHIHNYKSYGKPDRSRLRVCLDVLEEIYFHAHENGIKHILFAGDLVDSQGKLPTSVVNGVLATFLKLAMKYPEIICYAISGNHDHASKNLIHEPAITALDFVADGVPNNFIIIDNKDKIIADNILVSGVPYYEIPEHYNQALAQRKEAVDRYKQQEPKFYTILLVHQTPEGLPNPNIPTDTNPNDPVYYSWDDVNCGHIHDRMELTDRFTLVGNTHHRDRADEGKEKGFYVLDTVARKKKFVSLKGLYPEFITVRLGPGEVMPYDPVNYTVPEYTEAKALSGTVDTEDFAGDLSEQKLVENYWQEVDGEDKELLSIGLDRKSVV